MDWEQTDLDGDSQKQTTSGPLRAPSLIHYFRRKSPHPTTEEQMKQRQFCGLVLKALT